MHLDKADQPGHKGTFLNGHRSCLGVLDHSVHRRLSTIWLHLTFQLHFHFFPYRTSVAPETSVLPGRLLFILQDPISASSLQGPNKKKWALFQPPFP